MRQGNLVLGAWCFVRELRTQIANTRYAKFRPNQRGAASGDLLRKLGFASGNLIASRQAHSDGARVEVSSSVAPTPQLDSVEGSPSEHPNRLKITLLHTTNDDSG